MLHESAGAGAVRVVRMGVFGIWLLLAALTPLHQLAHLPDFVFLPPGVLRLGSDSAWSWFLTPVPLTTFRVALVAVFAAVVLLRRPPRSLLLVAALLALLFHGLLLGFGAFLDHLRFGILYLAILLALAPIGGDREPAHAPEVLRLGALLLATTYSLIGLHRVFVGGWEIFANDALPVYMIVRTVEPGSSAFDLSWSLLSVSWLIPLMKAGFVGTTLLEILSPVAVFHRRFRWIWIAAIVGFHFTTLVTMNIFFWENLVLIALLFTELPSWLARWFRLRREGGACDHSRTSRAAASA